MQRFIFFTLFLSSLVSANAQIYVPIDTANADQRKRESENYLTNAKQYISTKYKYLDSSQRSFIKKTCKNRDRYVSEQIVKGKWVFDARFDSLINSIVRCITDSNPTISPDMRFHIHRNISLNAASIGNGYFLINIGCFNFLQNEHQLASVLSHEIGHLYLNHAEEDFLTRFEQENSSEMKDAVEGINHQKYNKGESAKSKLKEILYSNGARNKKQEFQADSIGYVFYKKSRFNNADYIQSLRLMAEYDTLRPKGLTIEIYKQLFDLPELKFKDEWLKKEDFSLYDYTKFKERYNEDSLMDHPETLVRIDRLKKLFPELDSTSSAKPSQQFLKLKQIARFEQLPSLYIEEEYGVGVYLCMYNLQENPKDDYSLMWLGRFFAGITKARKEYTLNRYLDRLSPKYQSESYQQFLSFMWNLSLPDLQKIESTYAKKEPV